MPLNLPEKIEGPAAWTGADMQGREDVWLALSGCF